MQEKTALAQESLSDSESACACPPQDLGVSGFLDSSLNSVGMPIAMRLCLCVCVCVCACMCEGAHVCVQGSIPRREGGRQLSDIMEVVPSPSGEVSSSTASPPDARKDIARNAPAGQDGSLGPAAPSISRTMHDSVHVAW